MLQQEEIKLRLNKALKPLKFTDGQQEEILQRISLFEITIEQMAKIESLIDLARYATRVTEARIGLIFEWIWSVFYGDVSPEQKVLIDIHLKDMEKTYSCFMGTEVTEQEKNNYKLYCEDKTVEITRIHAGFGNSIKIQLE